MKFLGKGTFNQVLLDDDGKTAIRIAELKHPLIKEDLEKSETIVKLLGKQNMTPSIFEIVEEGIIYDVLPEEFGISDETTYQWFVQKIEYLPFKFEVITYDYMFFLIWFFSFASTQFGFVHKDVKPNNILVRDYGKNVTFKFRYMDKTYRIDTSLVPVVMDFDYSSFTDTPRQKFAGTISYAPPETILRKLCGMPDVPNDYGYDWWGLGIMVCYKHLPKPIRKNQIVIDEYIEHNLDIFDYLDLDLVTSIAMTMINITLIKNALSKTFLPPYYEKEGFNIFYNQKNIKFLNRFIKDANLGEDDIQIPVELRPIVKQLLSWTADERTFDRNPWKYLEKFYGSVRDDFFADFTYEKK